MGGEGKSSFSCSCPGDSPCISSSRWTHCSSSAPLKCKGPNDFGVWQLQLLWRMMTLELLSCLAYFGSVACAIWEQVLVHLFSHRIWFHGWAWAHLRLLLLRGKILPWFLPPVLLAPVSSAAHRTMARSVSWSSWKPTLFRLGGGKLEQRKQLIHLGSSRS